MSEPISPELVLVDPAGRSAAIAALPPLEVHDFLRLMPLRPTEAAQRAGQVSAIRPARRAVPRPIAVTAYTTGAVIRVAIFDLSIVLLLALLIVALNLLR